jgi:hypothetical protein
MWKTFPSTAPASSTARVDRRRDRQILDRTGDRPGAVPALQHTVVDEHREQLLDVQGIALGGLGDPATERRVERGAEQVVEERPALSIGERLEMDRRGFGLAAPVRPNLEEILPSHTQEEDRRVLRPVAHVLDEIEEGLFGPVDVVDDDDEGLFPREGLEQLAHRPRRLLGG